MEGAFSAWIEEGVATWMLGGVWFISNGTLRAGLSVRRLAPALRKRSGTKRVTIAGNRHALRTDVSERSADRETCSELTVELCRYTDRA